MKRVFTLLLMLAIPLIAWSAYSSDAHEGIAEAQNLALDARTGLPIMVLVSQDHCPYCVQIKREILKPMLKAEDFKDELLIRELYIDLGTKVTDFQGKLRPSADLARDYGASLTPTLLFLGPDGKELAKRIVGINTPELFYFYVESAIKKSIAQMEQRH
ncbi:MAG: thioredoxin fold domain-containing protein [Candidatus Sedimenticola sp. PURPLELP]